MGMVIVDPDLTWTEQDRQWEAQLIERIGKMMELYEAPHVEQRCGECKTWTTESYCVRCIAMFESLDMWCEFHECFIGTCLGCLDEA